VKDFTDFDFYSCCLSTKEQPLMLKMGIGDLNEMQRNTCLLLLHREKRYATEGRVEQQAISATSGASKRAAEIGSIAEISAESRADGTDPAGD
jgi:hypothetical protein